MVCPQCGGKAEFTGDITNWTPDKQKTKVNPNLNVQLASSLDRIIFDSNTGRFIVQANQDENALEEHIRRMKRSPKIEPFPHKGRLWRSHEFKPAKEPNLNKNELRDDRNEEYDLEVMKSCDDLAIDG